MYLKVIDKVSSVSLLCGNCFFGYRESVYDSNTFDVLLYRACRIIVVEDHFQFFPVLSFLHCIFLLTCQVNQQYVSVFLTAGNIKFLLLHSGKGEIEIKNFFHEVYDFYAKVNLLMSVRSLFLFRVP
jgi:hypothetical protein